MHKRKLLLSLFTVLALFLLPLASEAVKLATWNLLNFPGSSGTAREDDFRLVVNKLGLDVLVVQEMYNSDGVNQFLSQVMNYSVKGRYAAAPFDDDPDTDTDNALFYRKSTISFISHKEIQDTPRNVSEYVLKVKAGPGTGTVFRVYSAHLKSSKGFEKEREREAKTLRNYLNGLRSNSLFMVCGDFNLYTSNEPAYQVLTGSQADNDGRVNDPVDKPGKWSDNAAFAILHTQSTRTKQFGGGASGGLDDRFDFILVSDGLLTDPKLAYVKNSYKAYGNDGKHLNKAVNTPPNTAVPIKIANALYEAADHLPVLIELLPLGGLPRAPSGLKANSLSSTSVKLVWNDNSANENGFRIERKTADDWTQIATVRADTETYSNSGLSSEYVYTYQVRAYNQAGDSAYTNEASRRPGEDIIVYVTETGTKYHRNGCQYLSQSKIPKTLLQAKAEGYTPCSVCNPPTFHR